MSAKLRYLIIGLYFSCFAALAIFIGVLPEVDRVYIHRSSVLGVGQPVGMGTDLKKRGILDILKKDSVPYYYIKFRYIDKAGNQKSATTSTIYTEEEARTIMQNGKLDIKYSDKGAVQADYKLGTAFYVGIIGTFGFGAVGVGFLGAVVLPVMRSTRIKIEGHDVLARFISAGRGTTMSRTETELCYIKMAYRDSETGEIESAKTEPMYELYEVGFFKQLGEFKARCYKNTAMILEDRSKAKEMLFKDDRGKAGETFFKQPPTF